MHEIRATALAATQIHPTKVQTTKIGTDEVQTLGRMTLPPCLNRGPTSPYEVQVVLARHDQSREGVLLGGSGAPTACSML
jgi:hypothetical protein